MEENSQVVHIHGVYKNCKIKISDFFQTFLLFTSVNLYIHTFAADTLFNAQFLFVGYDSRECRTYIKGKNFRSSFFVIFQTF